MPRKALYIVSYRRDGRMRDTKKAIYAYQQRGYTVYLAKGGNCYIARPIDLWETLD